MYTDKFGSFFGRLNKNGDVCVFHDNGERATRLDANVYPVGSEFSVKYEHSLGITITKQDADKIGIDMNEYYERQRKRRQQTESLRLPNFEHTGGYIPNTYCNFTRPRQSDYFEGKSGLFWNFGALSSFIFKRRKDLWGMPAIVQIKAIGLESEFNGGFTPHQLPGTFVSEAGINND